MSSSSTSPGEASLPVALAVSADMEAATRQHQAIQQDYDAFRTNFTAFAAARNLHFGRTEMTGVYMTLLDARRQQADEECRQ